MIFYSQSFSKSVPFESVFFGSIASIAGICGKSFTKVFDEYVQPLSLFVIYSGLPGSNKSSAVAIQKHEFSEMEIFCEIVKTSEKIFQREDFLSSESSNQTVVEQSLTNCRSAINSSKSNSFEIHFII